MIDKRRDTKGRVLRNSESQRPDGKYEFKYTDANGIRRSVYSWRLVETDGTPQGKRVCKPLRDLEKQIQKDIDDGISTTSGKTTLNDYYDEYIGTKFELKPSTRTNYKYMYNKYVRNEIGRKKITAIKYSDVKKFYLHLIKDIGFKPNSIEIVQCILHPVFHTAMRDGVIRLNPTDDVINEIKKSHDWEKPKRHALTVAQQDRLFDFVSGHSVYNHWKTILTVLLGTGCRVGEIVGLRWDDCDFENGIIDINHNLIYRVQENSGRCEFHITTPKTKAGIRIVPMFDDVKNALLQEYWRQSSSGFTTFEIDGYTNFIFSNRFGEPMSPHVINRAIERIIKDANAEEVILAQQENRPPIILPHFSCHHLRHTFCTRLCENEANIKVIQEIMGHRNIETTMDVYNEATKEKKMETFAELEGAIRIS